MWRVLSEAERPDIVRGGGEGFDFATCGSCGRQSVVDNVLVLFLDEGPARALIALPGVLTPEWEKVLEDLGEVLPPLVLKTLLPVTRGLLPVLLARDMDRDVSAPEAATAEVSGAFGARAACGYREFLERAAARIEQAAVFSLVQTLFGVADGELGHWLTANTRAYSESACRHVAAVLAAARDAVNLASAGTLALTPRVLESAAAGEDASSIETRFRSALLEHSARTVEPAVRELWRNAEDRDAEVSVPALRALLAGPDYQGPEGQGRRTALNLLAARLLGVGDGPSVREAVALLEEVRAVSTARDLPWAQATGNLATVFGARGRGDVLDDWTTSVTLSRDAADASADDRRSHSINLRNLGLALASRPGGSTPEELDEALVHLTASLEGLTADDNLEDWANSQVNLGIVHLRRGDAAAAGGPVRCGGRTSGGFRARPAARLCPAGPGGRVARRRPAGPGRGARGLPASGRHGGGPQRS